MYAAKCDSSTFIPARKQCIISHGVTGDLAAAMTDDAGAAADAVADDGAACRAAS